MLRSAVGKTHVLRVGTCDGLYHFIFSIDHVGIPFGLHSEIDQIHLSIEAQCVTTLLPLGDCHKGYNIFNACSKGIVG